MNNKKRVLSLFSGCGGMDIGFEGGFKCLKRSINTDIHPNWIAEEDARWVTVSKTGFETVFANDIRPDAKAAWVSYFSSIYENANEIYHIDSIVDLVKRAQAGEKVFPDNIDIVTGGLVYTLDLEALMVSFNSSDISSGRRTRFTCICFMACISVKVVPSKQREVISVSSGIEGNDSSMCFFKYSLRGLSVFASSD